MSGVCLTLWIWLSAAYLSGARAGLLFSFHQLNRKSGLSGRPRRVCRSGVAAPCGWVRVQVGRRSGKRTRLPIFATGYCPRFFWGSTVLVVCRRTVLRADQLRRPHLPAAAHTELACRRALVVDSHPQRSDELFWCRVGMAGYAAIRLVSHRPRVVSDQPHQLLNAAGLAVLRVPPARRASARGVDLDVAVTTRPVATSCRLAVWATI